MNVFGKGFIARNLKKVKIPKRFDIYAAGVSDSNLINKKEYVREINTLKKYLSKRDRKSIFVYISSISVLTTGVNKDYYIKNKINIEYIIQKQVPKYLIVRLPQIIGKNNNKKTLTNFIKNNILKQKPFYIWRGSKRNLIDIDDIKIILKRYLNKKPKINNIINIFNPSSILVKDLVILFGKILKKKVKIKIIQKKNKNINYSLINKNSTLPKKFYKGISDNDYLKNLIIKYYK